MNLRGLLLKLLYPLIKWIGAQHIPYSKKKMQAEHYYQVLEKAVPGSVFLTYTLGEASNLLIPGKYKHCAIMAATKNRPTVIEATGSGVRVTDLMDFILSKDAICVLNPLFASEHEMMVAALWATKQLGKPYDYGFAPGYEAFYCCELTYAAYTEALDGPSPWGLREFWGVPTVTPDDFLNAKKKWTKILEFSWPSG